MIFRWPLMVLFAVVALTVGTVASFVLPSEADTPQTIDLNEVDPQELIRAAGWRFAVVTATEGGVGFDGPELLREDDRYQYGQIVVLVDQSTDNDGNPVYKSERGLWLQEKALHVFATLEEAAAAATDLRVEVIAPLRATATAEARATATAKVGTQ